MYPEEDNPENIVEKGEITGNQHFLLLSQCFLLLSEFDSAQHIFTCWYCFFHF